MLRLHLHGESRMSTACHCSRENRLRTVKNGAGWVLPCVVLALLPKCPLCLGAWLSVALGIGLSTSAASMLHIFLISLCLLTFIICFLCQFFRLQNQPHT